MRKIYPKKFFIAALVASVAMSLPVNAQNIAMQDLQKSAVESAAKDKSNDFGAYKTLENLSEKYGLKLGKPSDKNKPLTRNEAALLLVNLVGKINQDKIELDGAEKAKLDVLKEELSQEIKDLMSKVATIDSSVTALKGNVSKLEESDKKSLKVDYGNNFKINGAMQGQYTGMFLKNDTNSPDPHNFYLPLADLTISGTPYNHINYLVRLAGQNALANPNNQGLLSDAYLSTDIVPHHTVYLGQTRVPIGQEGTTSPLSLEQCDYSQISRNFSNFRDLGVKVKGNWEFLDYYLGAYNGDKANNLDTFSRGMALASWAVIKPLYKTPKYGSLELGGGYYEGKYGNSQQTNLISNNVFGASAVYKYKKYELKGEYAQASGYLNNDQRADGWYIHNSYNLTNKLQLVARFDRFDPDRSIGKVRTEYTLGTNYALTDNVGLLFDYIFANDRALANNSNKIEVMTQVTF